jgi:hypothetical protein
VFADTPGSGMYNAHGDYMTAFEKDTGVALRWLGNPGTFSHCLSAVMRARVPAFVLEFASYAQRYAEVGLPVYHPSERQPAIPGPSPGGMNSSPSRSPSSCGRLTNSPARNAGRP